MNKEVWLIGVNPPCPRCDVIRQRIEYLTKENERSISFKKNAYSDQEACDFAASLGKVTGTAKDVEQKAGIQIDWNRFNEVRVNPSNPPEDAHIFEGPATQWSPELDEVLSLCQEKAETVGVLMTPILIIDGKVMHYGSVPSLENLKAWLS